MPLIPQSPFASPNAPHPIDVHVGKRLRQRRHEIGITQEKLAEESGLTFQQIQKYENAKNRVSVSRLHDFSTILDVPVSWFFGGFELLAGFAEPEQEGFSGPSKKADPLNNAETKELLRVYYSLPDKKLRRELIKFMKQMVSTLDTKS